MRSFIRSFNGPVALAAAAVVASLGGQSAFAGTATFTGATPATGTPVFPYPGTNTNVSYFSLDTTAANFSNSAGGSAYIAGDDVVFNTAAGGLLATQSTFNGGSSTTPTAAPASLTFSGGNASTVWTFLRASTSTSGSSNSAGFYSTTNVYNSTAGNPLYPIGVGADSFGAGSPFATTSASTTNTNVTLDSSFLGKVIFRSRPSNGAPTGTVTINGGTLEINDSQALPGKAQPTINLGGGTFAININTGRYASGDGNSNPGSSDFRSTSSAMNVTQDSTLANNQVDDAGNSRFLSNAWGAAINITAGKTLTVATGSQYVSIFPQSSTSNVSAGGLNTVGSGYGTISLGTSNGVLRFGSAGSGSATAAAAQASGNTTTNFDAGNGTGAFLANVAFSSSAASTFNMGGLTGGANTFVLGSAQASQNASSTDVYSVGALNLNQTFAGKITNGVGSATRITGLAKVGSGTQTLGNNFFSGAITVSDATGSNTGTLRAGGTRTLTDSNAAVTINNGATIDLNGNSPNAGKAITLAGGSLINNGAAAVTLGTGTSASLTAGAAAGGTYTSTAGVAANGPTVTVTGGNGSGATATALMHLVSVGTPNVRGAYAVAPTVTVSAPDVAGGRQAIVNAIIDKTTGALSFQLADAGFGYTKTPTITIAGGTLQTGGTAADVSTATVTVAVDSVLLNSAGTGYTAAPTLAFTATGTGGQVAQTTAAVGTAGFGSVSLTANSNVGGSGDLTINPAITGTGFGLTKVGAGRTTLGGVNSYTGNTVVSAGELDLADDAALRFVVGASGVNNAITGTGTLVLAGDFSLDLSGAATTLGSAWQLVDNASLNETYANSFSILGFTELANVWTGTVNGTTYQFSEATGLLTVGLVPEPASLAAIAGVGGLLLRRRRRAI